MKILASWLALLATPHLHASAQTCLGKTEAVNLANIKPADTFQSHADELAQLLALDGSAESSQVNALVVCPSGDGQVIQGLKMGVLTAVSGSETQLGVLGAKKGNCFAFQLDPTDPIAAVVAKHSVSGIHVL